MLSRLLARGRHQAAEAGRRAALGLLGVMLMLPGVALMTHAAWVALADAHGPALASLVTGAFWTGVGIVLIALAAGRRRRPPPPPPASAVSLETLAVVEAFLRGFQTARRR